MTPVALLLIGFDRRDSRTDGAQGTSTLDLELFFSIMHTAQKHSKICRKAHISPNGRTDGSVGTSTLDVKLSYKRSANITNRTTENLLQVVLKRTVVLKLYHYTSNSCSL